MRISDWSSDVCSSDLESWLVAMPSEHRLADFEVIAISDLAGENFVAAHQEFGPGCHQQTQEMFLAAGVRLHVVARAFRRLTMLLLVHSGAGVTLVPGSFANGAMGGIVTRPVERGIGRAWRRASGCMNV